MYLKHRDNEMSRRPINVRVIDVFIISATLSSYLSYEINRFLSTTEACLEQIGGKNTNLCLYEMY